MPRASWRGLLRLSLVSCPIYLSPATTRAKSIRLHQVWQPAPVDVNEDAKPIIVDAIAKDTHFRTDESGVYWKVGEEFASHKTVIHSIGEYVRGDAHTNTVEGYFSIFKRGIYGVYHHVSQAHLKRYLCEFDFRYNYRIALGFDDATRATLAIKGIAGKTADLPTAS